MPQQVYLIDDKTMRSETALNQLFKQQQQTASPQTFTKILQTQSVSTSTSQSTESPDQATQNLETGGDKQVLTSGQVLTCVSSAPNQLPQFATSQQSKKISLSPSQQKQLQQLIFTKPQLVKAGNQVKQVLLLKTGVLSKSGKAEQAILCHSLEEDNAMSEMILVKQQESNPPQLVGETISHEQAQHLQLAVKNRQKTISKLKKKEPVSTNSKAMSSVSSSGPQGPPPPYTVSETKPVLSPVESAAQSKTEQTVTPMQLHDVNTSKVMSTYSVA